MQTKITLLISDNIQDLRFTIPLLASEQFQICPGIKFPQFFSDEVNQPESENCILISNNHEMPYQDIIRLSELHPIIIVDNREWNKEDMTYLIKCGVQDIISTSNTEDLASRIICATQRHKLHRNSHERQKMLSTLCDTLPFQMTYRIVKKPDEDAKFVYVSKGVSHISGLTQRDVLKNADILYQQIIPEDKIKLDKAEKIAVETLTPLEIEVRKKDRNGNLRWVHIRSFPSKEADGTIIWDGVESNITSYKQAEESVKMLLIENEILLERERHARAESERHGKIKDDFLATLSHELRTPINSVLGWVQLIRRGRLNGDEGKKAIDTIERNARVQAQLIADLLDMNSIISGKVHLQMEAVDARQFALSAIESIRPTAESKNIDVRLYMDSDLDLSISGDSSKLQQVLWNLLSNAIKFTPENGMVSIMISSEDSYVKFEVKDTGIGIPKEFLPFVFDRFRQADPTMTRKFGGLGLGLAIVKQLVLLHGGDIEVSSEGQSKGSCFTFKIPLAEQKSVQLPTPLEQEQGLNLLTSLAGSRILVVDDEPDALELVNKILTQSDAEVTCVSSTDKALQQLNVTKFDLLISDISMPDKDGFQLISEVRSSSHFKKSSEIPAIALTAFARPEDKQRAISAGYTAHIAKPVDAIALLELTSEILSAGLRSNAVNI